MSWSCYVSRVDRRGRTQTLRQKSRIVKEKPFLNLDQRRRDAADMARFCLRLHRPFSKSSEDPMRLSEEEVLQSLSEFLDSSACPVWLKMRYRKQNRIGRRNSLTLQSAAPAPETEAKKMQVEVPTAALPAQAEDLPEIQEEGQADIADIMKLRFV